MRAADLRRTRRWIWIGAGCWGVLAIVYILSIGLRNVSFGRPFLPSWWGVTNSLLMAAVGALLTPLVLLAIRRGPGAVERRSVAVLMYVAIGVAYWLAWALGLMGLNAVGLIRTPAPTLPAAIIFMAYISLTAYAVLVMLYEAVRSLRRARQKELEAVGIRAELARAQGAALRARLNPEFLFDTLATAGELMGSNARAARTVLADLGALLRASLGDNGDDLVPLHQELELVQRYIDIERARLNGGLHASIRTDPGTEGALLPALFLQQLVGELVGSGLPRGSGDMVVAISAHRAGGELRLRVDASGHDGGTGPTLLDDGGLAATRARLDLVYGADARLSADRRADGGVAIEIVVPQEEDHGYPG